jgi:predicted Zn-dependent peptidase
MEFKQATLPNGLDIVGEVNKSAKSAAVGFFVKTGSRDETEQINGVSHFLEHMLFKGTERLSAIEVNQAFDRTGAEFNAGTSWENTIFHAAVLPEYLVDVTKLWIELMRPALRDEDFNLEKGVIKQEIAMYKDTPSFDVMDRCRKLHFGEHPCGNSVLGSEESIDGLTAQQMRGYFTQRYASNNMIFACAGNFDWDQVRLTVEESCAKWQEQAVHRKLEHCDGSGEKERVEKPNLVREHISLMSAAVSAQDPRRFAAYLLATIVGDNVGSRYYWELVDKALAEAAVMQFWPMDGTGAFASYIQCGRANVPKVLDTIRTILDSLCNDGVREDELTKAKNKTLSTLVIENELSHGRLMRLGANWLYLQQYRTVEDDISSIRAVTIDDIHSLIEKFDLGNFTQVSIGPARDKKRKNQK